MPLLSNARFSKDRKHRYLLYRIWEPSKPLVGFIGLNPSTADETQDDPTIRRCIDYAKQWEYGGLIMGNIFAYRSTDPSELYNQKDPIGKHNDLWLAYMWQTCQLIVAAWGTHGKHLDRGNFVRHFYDNLHVLGLNKDGTPKHPLYLKRNLKPVPWPYDSSS